MDDPDIPMLDVGDFEVLDECEGEDDDDIQELQRDSEEEESDHDNPKRKNESFRRREEDDENSADLGDNILDVSIDVTENEFLESVSKDFSENIEDDIEERPKKSQANVRRKEPLVQLKRVDVKSKKVEDEPEIIQEVPRKRPGPKSKTMNLQTPLPKKPIQKITFSDNKKEENSNSKNTTTSTVTTNKSNTTDAVVKKNSNAQSPKGKVEQKVQNKTPAFLKKDLTDEEIMEHFDEIESTVLASESFVIQNEVDEENKERNSSDQQNDKENKNEEDKEKEENKEKEEDKEKEEAKEEENEDQNKEQNEEENWDTEMGDETRKRTYYKVEEEEFKEDEIWYREKLKAKKEMAEDKLTKLAKFLQYSYPMYKRWLDRNESFFGTAICKIEAPKHVPLDQLKQNRWKFICSKKKIQQSSSEEEKQADNSTDNKNDQSIWQVIPGVLDADLDNTDEYPPYVLQTVKVFEDFLESLKDEPLSDNKKDVKEEDKTKTDDNQETENGKPSEKQSLSDSFDGLNLLIRSNRQGDLMMHITGKNLSSELTDKIKDLFENGPGKDCKVLSIWSKSIIKDPVDNTLRTNSTFLSGTESIEDVIGSIKVQLSSKTNVWPNLLGTEVLTDVVTRYLVPTQKTVVLEIGCGTGHMTALLASKCQKVICLDVTKDTTESEAICKANNITNVEFVAGGKPKLFILDIMKSIGENKAVAVVNTNSTFGRSMEVICSLRRINTLGRIVVITTLTKQAVRSVIELSQPPTSDYGNPFIPIKACIVDTTPKNFGFDIIMSMERRTMRNLLKASPIPGLNRNPYGLISKSKQQAINNAEHGGIKPKFNKNFTGPPGSKYYPNPHFNPASKYQGKRPYHGNDTTSGYQPGIKKYKQFDKPWLGSKPRDNPSRDNDDGDLRDKLSGNRVEPNAIAQEMNEQKKILDAAREKLTGAGSSVDVETVKKLQEMLNLAIEKTSKLQSQLPPRSVWDRIAPVDSGLDEEAIKTNPPMRGRLVKETGPKDIIITTSNREGYSDGKSKKYTNLPPLEPNLIVPIGKPDRLKMAQTVVQKPSSAPYHKPGPNRFQGGNNRKPPPESFNRGKPQHFNEAHKKWSQSKPSPPRPVRLDAPRQISPPRRPISPARRPISPARRPISPARRQMSPPRRPISPAKPSANMPIARRPISPARRPLSPVSRRPLSPPRRGLLSPPRRQFSPPRRASSPGFRQHSSSRYPPNSGRPISPPRRHNSPPRRQPSPHNYRNSPPRQSSRQKSPPRRYADEWDIPSRGAVVESNSWSSRQEKEKSNWQEPPTSSSSLWDQGGGSTWDNRMDSNSNSRRAGPPNVQSGGPSNWDIQKKESSRHDSGRDMRQEPRHESRHEPRWEPPEKPFRNEKDDWGDLPEDARDPWGDDHPTSSQKDVRWNNQQPQQNQPQAWARDKPNENWQGKSNFPGNNMGGGLLGLNPTVSNLNPNLNMNMGMNVGMNNPNKPTWQGQQPQQQQANRNTNWLPPGNWQGGGGNGGPNLGVPLLLGNNWQQQPQQNFSNFPARPFNNSFINNRR